VGRLGRGTDAEEVDKIVAVTALPPFQPHPFLRFGHAQTIAGALLPRGLDAFARAAKPRTFRTDVDTQVVAQLHWQADRARAPTVVLLHGLAGSADSGYMVATAQKAFERGCNVVRLNARNCGGTEHLTPTLYHAGLALDPRMVLDELAATDGIDRVAVIGFSLGGSVAIHLAHEPPRRARLAAAAVACAPLDLAGCADSIERGVWNRLYSRRFVADMARVIVRKAALFPGRYDVARLAGLTTVRAFDDAFTAPHFGFRDAADYYAAKSALPLLARLAVPTLVLLSRDDSFVPVEPIVAAPRSRCVEVEVAAGGGHLGFIASKPVGPDRRWGERRIVEFVVERLNARAADAMC
jgi:predicted alpha/beta-fold hydrolase